ncbi:ORF6N domain-containing protein, partial [bacterium]|nr:ORF6N domain-containing protein [bacterium]
MTSTYRNGHVHVLALPRHILLSCPGCGHYGIVEKSMNVGAGLRACQKFWHKYRATTESCPYGLEQNLRCQFGTSRSWGGRRYPPYAFTEQGVAMLSSVLNSERAVKVNIEIMRAFVRLRGIIASNAKLAKRLDELESKYDKQFRQVFEAIRQLMIPPEKDQR